MIRQELQSLTGLGEDRGALSCAPNLGQNYENMLIKGIERHGASLTVGTFIIKAFLMMKMIAMIHLLLRRTCK